MRLLHKVLLAQAPLVAALALCCFLLYRTAPLALGRQARDLEVAVTTAAVLGLGLAVAASMRMTQRFLRPLAVLGQAARRLAQGDMQARARLEGHDEVAELASDFNAMAAEVERFRALAATDARAIAQAALDSLSDPVLVVRPDRSLLLLNRAASELLGAPRALDALPEPLRAAAERQVAAALSGGLLQARGLDEAVALGAARYLPRANPLHAPDGRLSAITVALVEVTRLARLEDLRGDVVATAAHELKTPLTSLGMALHLCAEGVAGPVSEHQAELLATARDDSARIQSLVDDILDLARWQAGRIELRPVAVGPAELVQGALDAHRGVAESSGVRLLAEIHPGCPAVSADPERVPVALANLVANALRHTPQGGSVTVACLPREGAVRFEVRDTGEGIAAEHLPRVFDRFFRVPGSAPGGTGLGLSIAREVVVAHGGAMGASSEPGHGSCFWFTLPAA
jgi:signal transduction histidine kinase/HAMP domain-containing protein